MLIPPLPPLCVCVTSAFRSLPVHCRDPASYRFGRVASPPPRLSDIHWLHMALLCNNTFEFQSLFGRLHCQPTTALHAHTRPGIQMRCRVFSCGIFFFFFFFFFIKQTFSSDAGDNAISSSFVRLGVCSRFVKLSEEMVNCLRETITHSCPAENCPSSTGFNSLSQHFREIILEMYLVQGRQTGTSFIISTKDPDSESVTALSSLYFLWEQNNSPLRRTAAAWIARR